MSTAYEGAGSRPLLSEPVENLIRDQPCGRVKGADGKPLTVDLLIVGSGYGGAIAAMRLADQGRTVFVFERGKEYVTGDFPETIQQAPRHVQFLPKNRDLPIGYPDALFDFRLDTPISVLVGNGLGGGSLINANVALEPEDAVFEDRAWPQPLRRRGVLDPSFRAVRDLLGVTTYESSRYAALRRLAVSLGMQGNACELAPITVTRDPNRPNPVNILQNPCIGCGNCVTGCNVGAKNTLPMNALPLAKSRGAKFYTGATVLSVEPDEKQEWNVRFRRTDTSKTVLQNEVFTLHARVVILAAGTLGSTEILLRSQALPNSRLEFSEHLGGRFSTNVDALAFGYAQKERVNAVATGDGAPGKRHWRDIGPTITGYIRACTDSGGRRRVTIEDGAVPSALVRLFGEVLAMASVFKRNSNITLPAWFRALANRDRDPLSVHADALHFSQVLLVQGDDEARGRLELKSCEEGAPHDPDRFRVRIRKPSDDEPPRQEPPVFEAVDRLLGQGEKHGGFDGGDYLPNPFWKVLPSELSQVSNLPPPGKNLLTVHPLGGCPMGDDVASGAVDHHGQVFKRDGALYQGLYVMDGAILPCAIGINPFLTIAALAYRNAEAVGQSLGWRVQGNGVLGNHEKIKTDIEDTLKNRHHPPAPDPDRTVEGTFVEFMTGKLLSDPVPPWVIDRFGTVHRREAEELNKDNKLVLKVEIAIVDVDAWLSNPNKGLDATATLYGNNGPVAPLRNEKLVRLGEGKGKVKLLAWDRPCCWLEQAWRMARAGWAFLRRRGTGSVDWPGLSKPRETLKMLAAWVYAGWNHANWRRLDYDFEFQPGSVRLHGTKELAYVDGKKDPWTALTELPFTLSGAEGSIEGLLEVDLVRLTQRAPFQAESPSDSPSVIAAMASAGMMFLRVLFQTHFWSFGAPSYPQQRIERNREPEPVRIEGEPPIEGRHIPLPVRVSDECADTINLRLVHYERRTPATRGSILLIGGLASSSRVFATDTIEESFSTYLYKLGYDVWMLDYRLSIALPPVGTLPAPSEIQSDMDQIAKHDMHEAVKYVYEKTEGPVQVFAHCIGAASLGMAILSGRCHDPGYVDKDGRKGRSMISALTLHAAHPWPVPSAINYMKANLAAFFKDALAWKRLDAVLPPLPQPGTTLAWNPNEGVVKPFDVMLDRIAGSIPFPPKLFPGGEAEAGQHREQTDGHGFGKNICSRMTLFYGWEWNHSGLAAETHRKLADLVGVANFETFRHIYFLLTRKRLTTRMGLDVYVKADNFERFWTFPTLFAHGRNNQLYDPRSAIASCRRLQDLRRQEEAEKRRKEAEKKQKEEATEKPIYGGAPYQVHWFEADPCGHFDFLFGKDANRIVYPSLSAFFQQKRNDSLPPQDRVALTKNEQDAWDNLNSKGLDVDRDPFWDYSPVPYRGPILGLVRRDDATGKIVLRLWVEPYRFSSRDAFIGAHRAPPRITIRPQELPRWGNQPVRDYPGTYWVYDLEIPDDYNEDIHVSIENLDAPPWTRLTVEAVSKVSYRDFKTMLSEKQVVELSLSEEVICGRTRTTPPAESAASAPPIPAVFWTDRQDDPGLPKELDALNVLVTDMPGYIGLARLPWFDRLRTKSKPDHMSFLVGSCRYPGSPFDELLADRVFEGMTKHVYAPKPGSGVDHVLLVGDQIYADATADVFDTQELRDRFAGQYRQAFGARYLRRLLGSAPTYMALDDHEFGDNWTGDENEVRLDDPFVKKFGASFQHGLAAAMAYQWSMSRRDGWAWPPDPPLVDNQGLWHTFESGGLPFFVMDSRTERDTRRAGRRYDDAAIVGDRQYEALENWLRTQHENNPDSPKFIVSGSVLAPVAKKHGPGDKGRKDNWLYRDNDGWAGYPGTWRKLVRLIVDEQIRKVIFIAGDYHFSALAKLTLSSDQLMKAKQRAPIEAYQIVASGLFVPLMFANPRATTDYEWIVPADLPFSDHQAAVRVEPLLLCTETSHFLRVDVQRMGTICVSARDCSGAAIAPLAGATGPFTINGDGVCWAL